MPEVGDIAPDFTLPSHQDRNKKVSLSEFKGKKNVVIAFHPLAFTPVCSTQTAAYETDLERFHGVDTEVLSISVDAQPSKAAWAKELGGVSYDLLSDFEPKGEVARKYGVYKEDAGISERALFIVNKDGRIHYKKVHNIPDLPVNDELFEALKDIES